MVLYFLVFGESLLNDGVSVVVYNTMITLSSQEHIGADQVRLTNRFPHKRMLSILDLKSINCTKIGSPKYFFLQLTQINFLMLKTKKNQLQNQFPKILILKLDKTKFPKNINCEIFQYVLAVLSFFTVVLGGILVGSVVGVLTR